MNCFVRIAFLGDASTDVTLTQKSTNTCYPHTAIVVDPIEWQDDELTGGSYPLFDKVRGVAGWYNPSCVGIGDGSIPGASDDRDQLVMTELVDKLPMKNLVKINSGNGF